MTKNIMRLAIIGLLIISLLGCSDRPSAGSSDIKEMFPADISVTDVNDSLQVKVEGDQKSLPVDSKVSLLIYNESSHFLFFSGENYVRLLIFREGEWIEVTNELTYSGSKTLSPK